MIGIGRRGAKGVGRATPATVAMPAMRSPPSWPSRNAIIEPFECSRTRAWRRPACGAPAPPAARGSRHVVDALARRVAAADAGVPGQELVLEEGTGALRIQ